MPGRGRSRSRPSAPAISPAGHGSCRRTSGTSTRARSSAARRSRSTAPACVGSSRPIPTLGYEVMRRFAHGPARAPAGDTPPAARRLRPQPVRWLSAGPMVPVPHRVVDRVAGDGRHLDPAAGAGRRLERRPALRPGAVQHALRVRRGRGPDLDQRRSPRAPARLVHTIRDVGPVTRAICARPARRHARRPRAVRQRLAAGRGRGARRRGRRRRARAGAAAPDRARGARRAGTLRPALSCSTAGGSPTQLLYREELGELGVARASRSPSPSTSPTADWAGEVGVVTKLIERAPFDPERRSRSSAGPRR